MADIRERTKETSVSDDGQSKVVKERVATDDSTAQKQTAVNVIWYIAGFIITLLIIRLVLKLAGANPDSGFVEIIYSVTDIFTAPFRSIFSTPTTEGDVVESVFETGTVVGIVVYTLLAWGVAKLFTLDQKNV